jgi:hemolysin III
LIVGGALYSIGGVLYALKWPNPWPTTFGHHEFFHACTAVAAICHYIAMWFAVF